MPVFAAVYDPSCDEMFKAYKGKGAFLNGKRIKISERRSGTIKVLVSPSYIYPLKEKILDIFKNVNDLEVHSFKGSFGIRYCNVARGTFDCAVMLPKDVFPDIAGSLIIREAGGMFLNDKWEEKITPKDRMFIAGSLFAFNRIRSIVEDNSLALTELMKIRNNP